MDENNVYIIRVYIYAGDEKPFMNNPTLSALYAEDYIPDAN